MTNIDILNNLVIGIISGIVSGIIVAALIWWLEHKQKIKTLKQDIKNALYAVNIPLMALHAEYALRSTYTNKLQLFISDMQMKMLEVEADKSFFKLSELVKSFDTNISTQQYGKLVNGYIKSPHCYKEEIMDATYIYYSEAFTTRPKKSLLQRIIDFFRT